MRYDRYIFWLGVLFIMFLLLVGRACAVEWNVPPLRKVSHWNTVYADVEGQLQAGHRYGGHNLFTNVHEITHAINSRVRGHISVNDSHNAIYIGGGKAYVFRNPRIKLSQVAAHVPPQARDGTFKTYLVDSTIETGKMFEGMLIVSHENSPLYVLDEFSAYIMSLRAQLETVKKGRSMDGWTADTAKVLKFSIFATALMRAIERFDPEYAEKADLAKFIFNLIVFSDELVSEASKYPETLDPRAEPIRKFFQANFVTQLIPAMHDNRKVHYQSAICWNGQCWSPSSQRQRQPLLRYRRQASHNTNTTARSQQQQAQAIQQQQAQAQATQQQALQQAHQDRQNLATVAGGANTAAQQNRQHLETLTEHLNSESKRIALMDGKTQAHDTSLSNLAKGMRDIREQLDKLAEQPPPLKSVSKTNGKPPEPRISGNAVYEQVMVNNEAISRSITTANKNYKIMNDRLNKIEDRLAKVPDYDRAVKEIIKRLPLTTVIYEDENGEAISELSYQIQLIGGELRLPPIPVEQYNEGGDLISFQTYPLGQPLRLGKRERVAE